MVVGGEWLVAVGEEGGVGGGRRGRHEHGHGDGRVEGAEGAGARVDVAEWVVGAQELGARLVAEFCDRDGKGSLGNHFRVTCFRSPLLLKCSPLLSAFPTFFTL